jgi:hypothetical protein
MKIDAWKVWLGSAALVAGVAALQNSSDLFITAALIGGLGIVTRVPALIANRLRSAAGEEARVIQLENYLRLTEDELASTTRELAALKEKREFDLQLRHPKAD